MREVADAPPAEIRFHRRIRFMASVREAVRYRELVLTLAEREIRVRYKQAFLGFAWAVITPVTLMVVFSLFIRRIARIDTGGVPYPLFSYVALLPWTFFSSSVSQGGTSLWSNASLLNKVYCPREVFPVASVVVAAVDSAIAFLALLALFAIFGFAPELTSVWAPLLLLVQVAFTLGVTLIVSVIVVYLRDLRHALPIILQLGLFATPVAYGIEAVPGWFRPYYAVLNPLGPVVDGYRRTVLMGLPPDWGLVLPAAMTACLTLLGGYWIFKRLEAGISDVA